MDEKPKRPRGRPPAPPDKALTSYVGFRCTPALHDKVKQAGDAWARGVLTKAKPPREPED